MHIDGAIFDLDGTLGDTLPVCYQAFRHVFHEFEGVTYSDEEIARMFGPSEKGIFQKRLPSKWESAWRAYLDRYAQLHPQYAKRFPGIEQALALFHENNIPLGIVTGKGMESAEISLDELGLASYFDVIEAGDDERGVKPEAIKRIVKRWELSAGNVIYVGDVPYDMRSARQAGVIPIAANWSNTRSREELQSENPAAIFATISEFISWLVSACRLSKEG
jgi:pyrophosphatase PpaX